MFDHNPKKFINNTLNTLNYKHPKFCYYVQDQEVLYKVIGYHHTVKQYKIQNTVTKQILMVGPYDIAGIWDKASVDRLKRQYG